MPVAIVDGRVRVVTDLKDLTGTTPVELYRCLPPFLKFIIRKLMAFNTDTADHTLILGEYNTTTGSWSKDKLTVRVPAGQVIVLDERQLPADYVMTTDPASAILSWATKLGESATAPVRVKAEFEVA